MYVSEKTVIGSVIGEFYSSFDMGHEISPATIKFYTSVMINNSCTSPLSIAESLHAICQQCMYHSVPMSTIICLSILFQQQFINFSENFYNKYGRVVLRSLAHIGGVYLPKYSTLCAGSISTETLHLISKYLKILSSSYQKLRYSHKTTLDDVTKSNTEILSEDAEKLIFIKTHKMSEIEDLNPIASTSHQIPEVKYANSDYSIISSERSVIVSASSIPTTNVNPIFEKPILPKKKKMFCKHYDNSKPWHFENTDSSKFSEIEYIALINIVFLSFYRSSSIDTVTIENFDEFLKGHLDNLSLTVDPFLYLMSEDVRINKKTLRQKQFDIREDIQSEIIINPLEQICKKLIQSSSITEDKQTELMRMEQSLSSPKIAEGLSNGGKALSAPIIRMCYRAYFFLDNTNLFNKNHWPVAKIESKEDIEEGNKKFTKTNRIKFTDFLDGILSNSNVFRRYTSNSDLNISVETLLYNVDVSPIVLEDDNIIVECSMLDDFIKSVDMTISEITNKNIVSLQNIESSKIDALEYSYNTTTGISKLFGSGSDTMFSNSLPIVCATYLDRATTETCKPLSYDPIRTTSDITKLATTYQTLFQMLIEIKTKCMGTTVVSEDLRKELSSLIIMLRQINVSRFRNMEFYMSMPSLDLWQSDLKVLVEFGTIEGLRFNLDTKTIKTYGETTSFYNVLECLSYFSYLNLPDGYKQQLLQTFMDWRLTEDRTLFNGEICEDYQEEFNSIKGFSTQPIRQILYTEMSKMNRSQRNEINKLLRATSSGKNTIDSVYNQTSKYSHTFEGDWSSYGHASIHLNGVNCLCTIIKAKIFLTMDSSEQMQIRFCLQEIYRMKYDRPLENSKEVYEPFMRELFTISEMQQYHVKQSDMYCINWRNDNEMPEFVRYYSGDVSKPSICIDPYMLGTYTKTTSERYETPEIKLNNGSLKVFMIADYRDRTVQTGFRKLLTSLNDGYGKNAMDDEIKSAKGKIETREVVNLKLPNNISGKSMTIMHLFLRHAQENIRAGMIETNLTMAIPSRRSHDKNDIASAIYSEMINSVKKRVEEMEYKTHLKGETSGLHRYTTKGLHDILTINPNIQKIKLEDTINKNFNRLNDTDNIRRFLDKGGFIEYGFTPFEDSFSNEVRWKLLSNTDILNRPIRIQTLYRSLIELSTDKYSGTFLTLPLIYMSLSDIVKKILKMSDFVKQHGILETELNLFHLMQTQHEFLVNFSVIEEPENTLKPLSIHYAPIRYRLPVNDTSSLSIDSITWLDKETGFVFGKFQMKLTQISKLGDQSEIARNIKHQLKRFYPDISEFMNSHTEKKTGNKMYYTAENLSIDRHRNACETSLEINLTDLISDSSLEYVMKLYNMNSLSMMYSSGVSALCIGYLLNKMNWYRCRYIEDCITMIIDMVYPRESNDSIDDTSELNWWGSSDTETE